MAAFATLTGQRGLALHIAHAPFLSAGSSAALENSGAPSSAASETCMGVSGQAKAASLYLETACPFSASGFMGLVFASARSFIRNAVLGVCPSSTASSWVL